MADASSNQELTLNKAPECTTCTFAHSPQRKSSQSKPTLTKTKRTFSCTEKDCQRVFSAGFNLRRHLNTAHKLDISHDSNRLKVKCLHPSCASQFVHVTKMLTHLENDHGIDIQRENLQFKNIDEFQKWKENEQMTNFVYFCKYQGIAVPKDNSHIVLYFKCQRDGSQRAHRPTGFLPKTNQIRGTVKMGMVCPARMVVRVSKEDGSVYVEYIQSHSHPISAEDSKRQPMPRSLKDDIESKLYSGLSEDQIMTELTGGNYIPTGKQGDRSNKGKRGDRSSVNYSIPVENGMYYINKKRVSMMKHRLSVPSAEGTPLPKKRKTAEDIAVQVATVRGQLKELLGYLDDDLICQTLLPDIRSLVTYLLSNCSAVKKTYAVQLEKAPEPQPTVTQEITLRQVNNNMPQSVIQAKFPSTLTCTTAIQKGVVPQTMKQTTPENSEPTFYFSDGKNIIRVAVKNHGRPGSIIPTSRSATVPSITSAPVNNAERANNELHPVSISKNFETPQNDSSSIGTVVEPIDVVEHPENVDAMQTMFDEKNSFPVSELGSESTTKQAENVNNQVEVVQIIDQPRLLYSLPTEGAYVTVCDMDSSVNAVGSNHGKTNKEVVGYVKEEQNNASILLNAILAANLCGTE